MLTDSKIKSLTARASLYKVGDGEGLFLKITSSGNKYWRFQYHFASKAKSLSLGKYPAISLFAAREERRKCQELIAKGIDPSLRRKAEKKQLAVTHENKLQAVALAWFEMNKPKWCEKHATKTWRRLEIHMLPTLGEFPIAEIKAAEVLQVLQKVQSSSTDNAHRLVHSCEGVFGYALVMGMLAYNPIRDIRRLLLPNVEGSFPVIPLAELPEFLTAFRELKARQQDKIAFTLLLLTALRTRELRYARWEDVNFTNAYLRIRAEAMKVKNQEDHIVPLSSQAIRALQELHKLTGHQEWLFPSRDRRKNPVMCENVINMMIEDMGYKGRMVGHSFRKLFSTVLNEYEFPADAIERQLAHRERNKVRAAYNNARLLRTRHFLMQWWADYLDGLTVSKADDTRLEFGHFPRGGTMPDFYRHGIDSRLYPAIPSAFAHRDNFESLVQSDKPLMN